MNSNKKYDFYKNAIYFLIANAVLLVSAIVILCIFGFNYGVNISHGRMILGISLTTIISLLIVLIYVGIRYDFVKALTILFVNAHNLLLSSAIICLIRVPVTESMIAGFALLVALTSVYTLIMTNKIKDINLKKVDFSEVIKNTLNESIKHILVYSLIAVGLLFLSLIAFNANVFNFARLFFVMMVVLIYSVVTIALPIWCFLSTKIKRVKRAKVDTNVDNQKVVKAVNLEEEKTATDVE